MEELKVAILLAGGLRTFWYSIDNILETFIIPNNADVFIYTGNDYSPMKDEPIVIDKLDNKIINKCSMALSRENPNIKNRKIIIDEEKFIRDKLKNYLKDIRFLQDNEDDILEFKNDFNKKLEHYEEYKKNNTELSISKTHNGPKKYIFDQYFRIYKCNEMKNEYSQKNNIKYDYVIRLRPDFYYNNKINLNKLKLEKNILYAPDQYEYKYSKFLVAEWFYFGSDDIMNIMTTGLYEQIFLNDKPHGRDFIGYNGIKPDDYSFVPEAQFAWIINKNNINIKLLKINKMNDYVGNRVEISKYNFIKKYIDNDHIYIIYCEININDLIY